jgi:hypothetical protein
MKTKKKTALTKQELAINRNMLLWGIKGIGRSDCPHFKPVINSLNTLNFEESTPEQLAEQIATIIEQIFDVILVAFDADELSTIQHKLR